MLLFLTIFSAFHLFVNSLIVENSTTDKPTVIGLVSTTVTTLIKSELTTNKTVSNETDSKTKPDTVQNVGRLFTFSTAPVIGSYCKNDSNCDQVLDSRCIKNTCKCKPDFVSFNSRKCLKKAKNLEDTCIEDVQCDSIFNSSGLVVCSGFHCICSADANLLNYKCYKKARIGKTCVQDPECSHIPYSYCLQGVCACEPDFSPNTEGTYCYPPINETDNGTYINCTHSSLVCQVLGEHTHCSDGKCVCWQGYHMSSGRCVINRRLGETCDVNSDCIIEQIVEPSGIRECKNKKCACVKGYTNLPEHNVCKSGSISSFKPSVYLSITTFIVLFCINLSHFTYK